jgi:hypothetical protein
VELREELGAREIRRPLRERAAREEWKEEQE